MKKLIKAAMMIGVWFSCATWTLSAATDNRSAQGLNPETNPDHRRLGYWRFNTADWKGEQGQLPIAAENIANVVSTNLDGRALQIPAAAAENAILRYRDVEADGQINIASGEGTIRFLFAPAWGSDDGTPGSPRGPGRWAKLFEYGGLSLIVSPNGSHLDLRSVDAQGRMVTNAQAIIQFTKGKWQRIQFSYSTRETAIVAGYNAAGSGLMPNAAAPARGQGFSIGGGTDGAMPALGLIDELETFNFAMKSDVFEEAVSADLVALAPPAVSLHWCDPRIANLGTSIQRRLFGSEPWTVLVTNLHSLNYTDASSSLVVGQGYEYRLVTPGSRSRSVFVGLKLPPAQSRGRVLLLVDQTLINALSTQLVNLREDLAGDGWTVLQFPVPRHDDAVWAKNPSSIRRIKDLIRVQYKSDPAITKVIYLLGHVAIPFSGGMAPDGHFARAWPADGYYGSLTESNWTDATVNFREPNPFGALSTNVPGDGIFDLNFFPTNAAGAVLDVAVGRADFARMPEFSSRSASSAGKSEVDLLRQYLSKTRRYRRGEMVLAGRIIIKAGAPDQESLVPVLASATRISSRFYRNDPSRIYFEDLFFNRAKTFLFGFQNGHGSYVAIREAAGANLHFAKDLVEPKNEPQCGFYFLGGSYFGEWQTAGNLLRALLATPNFGLASMYTLSTEWHLEGMALDQCLGDALRFTLTQNLPHAYTYAAILGDPTLRCNVLAPPNGLTAVPRNGQIELTWSSIPDPDVRYVVYRSTSDLTGPFLRLNPDPIGGTNFVDRAPPAGAKTYQVRALRLTLTGSGSFTNQSQGRFITTQ